MKKNDIVEYIKKNKNKSYDALYTTNYILYLL